MGHIRNDSTSRNSLDPDRKADDVTNNRRKAIRARIRRATIRILTSKLRPKWREYAWHLAHGFINVDTGISYALPSTVAQRSRGSLRVQDGKDAAAALVREGFLKATERNGRVEYSFIARDDIEIPDPLVAIGEDIKERNKRLDEIAQSGFASTEKVVALVAGYVLNVEIADVSQRFLADVVGLSKSVVHTAAKQLSGVCPVPVRRLSGARSGNEVKPTASAPNLVNPVILGNLDTHVSASASADARSQTDQIDETELEETHDAVAQILGDVGTPMSMGGLVKGSTEPNWRSHLTGAQIARAVKAGLLWRLRVWSEKKKKHIDYITTPEIGWCGLDERVDKSIEEPQPQLPLGKTVRRAK